VAAVEAGGSLVEQAERLDPERALGETIMLGLRLVGGLDLGAVRERFGVDVGERHGDVIARLVGARFGCD